MSSPAAGTSAVRTSDPASLVLPGEQRLVDDLDPHELRALQGERLAAMVAYACAASPFWRRKFDAAGVDPSAIRSIDDLAALPTCDRAELQDDQDRHPPAGSYACTPPTAWVRVFTTSGTSGRRLRRVLSARDWELFIARSGLDAALRPDDTVLLLSPTDGLFGPAANLEVSVRAGATVLAAGRWDTATRLRELKTWRPTVLMGSASYLVRLTEQALHDGLDLSDGSVRLVLSAGEPGGSVPATRALLRERLGGARIVDRYGMTELPTLTRCGCAAHEGALHLNEDFVAVECLEPGGDRPVAPGEPGELVFTNLLNDTQPVFRYRSADIGRLSAPGRCDCGLPLRRLERSVEGRVDDMIWYHGVNLFPSAVEDVVRGRDDLGSDYRLVLRGRRDWPELTVEVEPAAAVDNAARARLQSDVEAALQAALQVRPRVALVEPGRLAEGGTSGKTRRILDLRDEGHASEGSGA